MKNYWHVLIWLVTVNHHANRWGGVFRFNQLKLHCSCAIHSRHSQEDTHLILHLARGSVFKKNLRERRSSPSSVYQTPLNLDSIVIPYISCRRTTSPSQGDGLLLRSRSQTGLRGKMWNGLHLLPPQLPPLQESGRYSVS